MKNCFNYFFSFLLETSIDTHGIFSTYFYGVEIVISVDEIQNFKSPVAKKIIFLFLRSLFARALAAEKKTITTPTFCLKLISSRTGECINFLCNELKNWLNLIFHKCLKVLRYRPDEMGSRGIRI